MSTSQRLTLIGLYNYEPTLFDNLSLPTGYDNDTFIESLLLEHGEKCVLYSNPTFLKSAIGTWSNKWSLELTRIYESLTAEYNPIYNYDRYEEYSDTVSTETSNEKSGTDNTTTSGTNNTTSNGTNDTETSNSNTKTTTSTASHTATDNPDYDETTSRTGDEEHEHLTSAYNSSSYEESSKDIISGGTVNINRAGTTQNLSESSTQNDNETGTGSESVNNTTNETINNSTTGTSNNTSTENVSGTENKSVTHDAHLYGNIGVTTSAQMVTEVVEQRIKYNLYEVATRLFANELLIGIY